MRQRDTENNGEEDPYLLELEAELAADVSPEEGNRAPWRRHSAWGWIRMRWWQGELSVRV